MLGELLKRASAEDFEAVSLSVEDGDPATEVYERHGFEKPFRIGNAWTIEL